MIRLTINAHIDSEIHLFSKPVILIGSDTSQVDLVLTGEEIRPVHLKITEQSGVFFALNLVNDPFLSINGLPFGKKQLKDGDKIQIDQTEILFENLSQDKRSQFQDEKKEFQEVKVTPKNEPLLDIQLPFDEEVELLGEEELEDSKLERLLKGTTPFEESFNEQKSSFIETRSKDDGTELKYKPSLKDDYLKDLDDDLSSEKKEAGNKSDGYRKSVKKIVTILFFFILLLTGIGSLIFFSLIGKNERYEVKAAQGVADIAMALKHAQLYHIKPHNQNWLDGDFLKSSLQSIIPNTSSYALNLDAQGKFKCCSYNLRIYTNRDLSRFLLIAQPVSRFLNSLVSKSIIVLDSSSMELRTFKEVRTINRLLANSDPLEAANGKEIEDLVKKGQLIRLTVLAKESHSPDFSPPKNVAWIKPGAENYVYNAPRYYRLTGDLLPRAISLSSKGTGQKVTALKKGVANLSQLKDLILYSKDEKTAIASRKSIMLFAPSDKFLFGYIELKNGQFVDAYLLKSQEDSKEANLTEISAIHGPIALVERPVIAENVGQTNDIEIDINHPVYIQLKALVITRENELRPLSSGIYHLLSQELEAPKAYSQSEFQNLYHTYLITSSRHKQIIKETIMKLYHQYEEMPLNQFMAFINSFRLNHLISQKNETLSLIDENCIQNLENIFAHIERCQSILELDNLFHIALTWVTFDYLKNPEELIKYQNILRNHILDQLSSFLITPTKLVPIKAEDKEILIHILDHERFIHSDEKKFYLSEFEEMIQKDKKFVPNLGAPNEI